MPGVCSLDWLMNGLVHVSFKFVLGWLRSGTILPLLSVGRSFTGSRERAEVGMPVMRMCSPAFATIAILVPCCHAYAQPKCPELAKLRGEAAKVATQLTAMAGCEAYNRFSTTWDRIVRYANDHRESCEISSFSLMEIESRHREALTMRDAICTGRLLRPFPPDVIRQ